MKAKQKERIAELEESVRVLLLFASATFNHEELAKRSWDYCEFLRYGYPSKKIIKRYAPTGTR